MNKIESGIKDFFREKTFADEILVMATGKSSEEITELGPKIFSDLVTIMGAGIATYMVYVMETFAKEKHLKNREKALKQLDLTPARVGESFANASPREQEGTVIALYILNSHKYEVEKALLAFLPKMTNPGIS